MTEHPSCRSRSTGRSASARPAVVGVVVAVLLLGACSTGAPRPSAAPVTTAPGSTGPATALPASTAPTATAPTPGPTATPGTATTEERTFDHGGLHRTYLLHVPARLAAPLPLVVVLHGGGGNPANQAALTGFDRLADEHGFVVAYPAGTDANWADGRGKSEPDRNGVDDVGFLRSLVGELVTELGVDPGWVFATGFSNGGFMSNVLACRHPAVFAAVAPVSGTLGTDVTCTPSRPISVLTIAGTADPIVPFTGGEMLGRGGTSTILGMADLVARWRSLDGCPAAAEVDGAGTGAGTDGTSASRTSAQPCADGTAVDTITVEGGGHTWPGGPQYLPATVVGTASDAFSASEVIWDFFAAHHR